MNPIYLNMIKAFAADITDDEIRNFVLNLSDDDFVKHRKFANIIIDNETQRRGV